MNKRLFLLITFLLILITFFNIKLYTNTKKEVLENQDYLIKLEEKIKKITALKQKYRLNKFLLNRIKKFCSVTKKDETYIIFCKNLDTSKFNTVQNILFKTNFKIKNFKIEKNSLVNITAEIEK